MKTRGIFSKELICKRILKSVTNYEVFQSRGNVNEASARSVSSGRSLEGSCYALLISK